MNYTCKHKAIKWIKYRNLKNDINSSIITVVHDGVQIDSVDDHNEIQHEIQTEEYHVSDDNDDNDNSNNDSTIEKKVSGVYS